ncbi:hypothetical protein K491DRAFT_699841 [Lophiostoma macrostomum CBS 122681]|uniref:Mitochondrial export translocase Oxa2 n=1 Tax=Lophiostoma macrostomum CBS 122681 TaxID=1314788 RepID=A0A6A6SLQ2_9PLEO|nr:hypothetical protein K491DRAFT_699841 [Lophiostoma macrostomum CBS 122681]
MLSPRLLRPPALQLLAGHGRLLVPIKHPAGAAILPTIRGFHATASRRAESLSSLDVSMNAAQELLCTLPHELLQLIHTGLPWYAALPASAFVVRALLTFTAGIRVRPRIARYYNINPLRHAMSLQILQKYMKTGGFSNPTQAKRVISASIKQETNSLHKRWHCSVWQQVSFAIGQFPIFLVMAESVRRMAATKDGLLNMALRGVGLIGGDTETNAAIVDGQWVADLTANPWFEPSLATEGMLWFPNLLIPDPTGLLPFVLSAVMFTNVYVAKNSATGNFERGSSFSRRVRVFMIGVSLCIGPFCQYLPSGLILYWISSTSSAMAWNAWLDRRYPVAEGFGPCKRKLVQLPLRLPRK